MGGWGSARPRQLMLGCICKRQTVAEIAAPLPAVPCQALSVQHFYVPASRLFTTQVHHLNRELLAERTRVKALSEELENPLNVHRWALDLIAGCMRLRSPQLSVHRWPVRGQRQGM